MKSSQGMAAGLIISDNGDREDMITMTRGGLKVDAIEKKMSIPVVATLKATGDTMRKTLMEKDVVAHFDFSHWEDKEKEFTLKRAIAEHPQGNTALTWHNLAIAMHLQGRHKDEDAIAALETSVSMKASIEAFDMLAALHERKGSFLKVAQTKCKAAAWSHKDAVEHFRRDTKGGALKSAAQAAYLRSKEGQEAADKSLHVCDVEAARQEDEEDAHLDL
jgi:hypothetical protein